MLTGSPYIQLRLEESYSQRETEAADGLAHNEDIRLDARSLKGEEAACSGTAHLNIVNDKEHIVLFAQLLTALKEFFFKNIDSSLGLNGLEDEGSGLVDTGVVIIKDSIHIIDDVKTREHIRCRNMGDIAKAYACALSCALIGSKGKGT